MSKRDLQLSGRVIGAGFLVVCLLTILGYSTLGQTSSAHALLISQSPASLSSTNAQASLKHAPHGNAHVTWDAKQMTLTVTLTMSGLAANSTAHAADINKGSCETTNSGLVTNLEAVVPRGPRLSPQANPPQTGRSVTPSASATASGGRFSPQNSLKASDLLTPQSSPTENTRTGEGFSNTTITVLAVPTLKTGIPSSGWFIAIHNGTTLSADKTAIACGDIINFNTSTATNQFVDLTLGATKDPNQAANGVVTLAVKNNQLTVTITMSGLVAGSKHQAHIHQGSCRDQGPVVYALNPVAADMHGEGTSTTIIPKVSALLSDWYINVHLGATATDLSTQTGFDPLVCGDIDINSAIG